MAIGKSAKKRIQTVHAGLAKPAAKRDDKKKAGKK